MSEQTLLENHLILLLAPLELLSLLCESIRLLKVKVRGSNHAVVGGGRVVGIAGRGHMTKLADLTAPNKRTNKGQWIYDISLRQESTRHA